LRLAAEKFITAPKELLIRRLGGNTEGTESRGGDYETESVRYVDFRGNINTIGTVLVILISAVVASLFSIQPCGAAEVLVCSVYYQPATGSGTRQPRTGSGGQLVTIPGYSFGFSFVPGPGITPPPVPVATNPNPKIVFGPYIVLGAPPTTITYALAYVNVSGGAGGAITVFPGANGNMLPYVNVPVQNPPQNINVENVYFPVVEGPPCKPDTVCSTSADIDEFSETLGGLIDDTFVQVFTPPTSTSPDSTLTETANVNGAVDTTGNSVPINNSVRINALNPPVPFQSTATGGIFDKWVTGPGGTISSSNHQDLDVNKQTSDYALALYRSACPAGYYWNPSPTISQCSIAPTTTRYCLPTGGDRKCPPPRPGPDPVTWCEKLCTCIKESECPH